MCVLLECFNVHCEYHVATYLAGTKFLWDKNSLNKLDVEDTTSYWYPFGQSVIFEKLVHG